MSVTGWKGASRRVLLGCLVLTVLLAEAVARAPTAKPQGKAVGRTIELPGRVEASEETTVYARVAGVVRSVHVNLGDRVKKGQVLAELEVPETEAQLKHKQALVTQAQAELDQARRALPAAPGAAARAQVQE